MFLMLHDTFEIFVTKIDCFIVVVVVIVSNDKFNDN